MVGHGIAQNGLNGIGGPRAGPGTLEEQTAPREYLFPLAAVSGHW